MLQNSWQYAKPIPTKTRYKKASEIIKWLEDERYVYVDSTRVYHKWISGKRYAHEAMFIHDIAGTIHAGGNYDPPKEWLEEVTE
jgi:hypothetical protein